MRLGTLVKLGAAAGFVAAAANPKVREAVSKKASELAQKFGLFKQNSADSEEAPTKERDRDAEHQTTSAPTSPTSSS